MLVTACGEDSESQSASTHRPVGGPNGGHTAHLLPVLFVLYGIHGTARLGVKHEVEACVFTETTRVTQEGVLLVIVNGPAGI